MPGSVTKAGCPISRSFFARCGIPLRLLSDSRLSPMHLPVSIGGSAHLAKNERDMGHPASSGSQEFARLLGSLPAFSPCTDLAESIDNTRSVSRSTADPLVPALLLQPVHACAERWHAWPKHHLAAGLIAIYSRRFKEPSENTERCTQIYSSFSEIAGRPTAACISSMTRSRRPIGART